MTPPPCRPRAAVVVAALMAGAIAPLPGQARLAPLPRVEAATLPGNPLRALLLGHTADSPPNLPDTHPGTYWKEGGIAGALVIGIIAAVLVHELCGSDSAEEHCSTRVAGGALLGGAVGFTAGALVGGQIRKES